MLDVTKILELKDGWLDGKGVAPNKKKVREFAGLWRQFWPRSLPEPYAYPTPEGGMLLEWDGYGEASLELDFDKQIASFHAFGIGDKDIERDIPLSAVVELFKFLTSHFQTTKKYEQHHLQR